MKERKRLTRTEESNRKRSEGLKKAWREGRMQGTTGLPVTPEWRAAISMGMQGRHLSPQHKWKLSQKLKGNTNRRGKRLKESGLGALHRGQMRELLENEDWQEGWDAEGYRFDFILPARECVVDLLESRGEWEEYDQRAKVVEEIGFRYILLAQPGLEDILNDI